VEIYLHSRSTSSWRGTYLSSVTTLPYLNIPVYNIKINTTIFIVKAGGGGEQHGRSSVYETVTLEDGHYFHTVGPNIRTKISN
jgi:hypothetical protein